jgi:hypothetical protein
VLYLRFSYHDASPKAISGRTSYLRVRLEFLPYPKLIPRLFNAGGFGPPCGVTRTSPWPGVDHPVSGRCQPTFRPFRLAFASAPVSHLNLAGEHHSPVHSTKGTPSHVMHASTACRHTVSGSLSLRSRGPFHLSLTVLSAIGCQGVFSLRRWSSQIPTGFLVSRGTWVPAPQSKFSFAYGVLTLSDRPSHAVRLKNFFLTLRGDCSLLHAGPATPFLQRLHPITQVRFRLFRVRSPLLAESLLFSLPRGT